MRKTGIGLGTYESFGDIEAGFRQMKMHGYDCADYGYFVDDKKGLFSMDDKAFEETLLTYRHAAEAVGIELYQSHGPWRYPPKDATKEDRLERMEKMKRTIRGCEILGCSCMVIHPIMPFGTADDGDADELFRINKEFFTELVKTAEGEQVIICLENMPFPNFPLSRPKDIYKLVKDINSPWMKICLDTGHCAAAGESPAEALKLCGADIKTLHIHDNNGRSDKHWLPFGGVIDWEAFREALSYVPEEVPANLEIKGFANMPNNMKEYFMNGVARIARYLCGEEF